MHVRVRALGKPDTIVVVESKLTKIENFRKVIKEKFDVEPKLQRLFYGGKVLENGYTFHDYNIKLNDVIQLIVKVQPTNSPEKKCHDNLVKSNAAEEKDKENSNVYNDAESKFFAVGDLIDMKDQEHGAWFEGKILRIVKDPTNNSDNELNNCIEENINLKKDSDTENKPPTDCVQHSASKKKKGITDYFSNTPNKKKIVTKLEIDPICNESISNESNLLFQVQLEDDDEDTDTYCNIKNIRPRARKLIDIKDLKVGQKVMINHNTDNILEKGYWYDFKIQEIKKLRTNYELIGTCYLGPESIPQNDTKARILDKIFEIEDVVPLSQRTEDYKKTMNTQPEKRSSPLNCLSCRDDEDMLCKDCGCFLCLGKEKPETIVLCDECNNGYHMTCLKPPLKELPEDDWYCPSCKRDVTDVIAPGAAKQAKKSNSSKSNRDWGRGMACVGKTKTSAMPANHFGPIPGIEVGMCWRFRIQLSETGVHRPPVSGIHGRDVEGAYSIVLSGGYEDDVDYGNEFTYTGSGGRDLSGNKRTAEQSCDQTLTRENKALARNCAVKQISEEGGDAGENWKEGKPVRVVRSYKMLRHFPKYAPKEGIRYDGIYKVVKYYPEKGLSGFRVWKYLLRRDDSNLAPWEPGVKEYPIIYPDGYLEAEAEKKAIKEKKSKTLKVGKKRALKELNTSSESEKSPPGKKRKTRNSNTLKSKDKKNNSIIVSPKSKIPNIFLTKSPKSPKIQNVINKTDSELNEIEKNIIENDELNIKLWNECIEVYKTQGKKEFVDHVTQVFLCIICQDVPAQPVTTPCLHNFCMACIKLAFKSTSSPTCPACRGNLSKYDPQENDKLKSALLTIMPGYDAGRK